MGIVLTLLTEVSGTIPWPKAPQLCKGAEHSTQSSCSQGPTPCILTLSVLPKGVKTRRFKFDVTGHIYHLKISYQPLDLYKTLTVVQACDTHHFIRSPAVNE